MGFGPLSAGFPERTYVGSGPGAVGHDYVDRSAGPTVKAGKKAPVSLLEVAAEPLTRAGVEAFAEGGGGVKGAEHVGGDGWVMDVGAGGDGGKYDFGEGKGKGVAHCIDENVRNKHREGVISETERA